MLREVDFLISSLKQKYSKNSVFVFGLISPQAGNLSFKWKYSWN